MSDDQPLPHAPRRPARMADTFIGPEAGTIPSPTGFVLDGAIYALDGQPPPAVSRGWGTPPWMWWRRY